MPEKDLPWLSRFVQKSKHFTYYGRVKPDAFVETRPFRTSVYTHQSYRTDIDWMVGRTLYGERLKGAADISRREIEFLGMSARHEESSIKSEYHQDLYGQGDDVTTKKERARKLADSAVFVKYPDDINVKIPKVSYVVVLGTKDESSRFLALCEQFQHCDNTNWECIVINDGNNQWANKFANKLADYNVACSAYHYRWIIQETAIGVSASIERARGLALSNNIVNICNYNWKPSIEKSNQRDRQWLIAITRFFKIATGAIWRMKKGCLKHF